MLIRRQWELCFNRRKWEVPQLESSRIRIFLRGSKGEAGKARSRPVAARGIAQVLLYKYQEPNCQYQDQDSQAAHQNKGAVDVGGVDVGHGHFVWCRSGEVVFAIFAEVQKGNVACLIALGAEHAIQRLRILCRELVADFAATVAASESQFVAHRAHRPIKLAFGIR